MFLSRCFPDPTQAGLAVAKTFYFFFYGAFGSLFPLMGVYFKQLGMDAAQAGLLSGVRPIVEYLAIPFWNQIASKLHKGKIMMLLSLACWIGFTVPIGHIHPPVVSCKFYNETSDKIYLQVRTVVTLIILSVLFSVFIWVSVQCPRNLFYIRNRYPGKNIDKPVIL